MNTVEILEIFKWKKKNVKALLTVLASVLLLINCLFVQLFVPGGAQLLQLQQDLIPRCSSLLCSYHLLKQMSLTLSSSIPLDILWVHTPHGPIHQKKSKFICKPWFLMQMCVYGRAVIVAKSLSIESNRISVLCQV